MTTEIVVDEPVVYGENSELYSVVPGTYTLKRDDRLKIKIKFRLEKNPDGEIDYISFYGPKMQLKDEDGLNVIEGWDQMKLADGEKEKLETFLTKEPGSEIEVLYVNGKSGNPTVKGAKVVGTVEKHGRQKKIIVFKYRPKKKYRKKQGHRQPYTKVTIKSIVG